MHQNIITPLGIEHKDEYLVYRESNGQFTALSRNDGTVKTWSTATGKLLHVNTVDPGILGSSSLQEFSKYKPYGQDDQEEYNHLIDTHSWNDRYISLIVRDLSDDNNPQ